MNMVERFFRDLTEDAIRDGSFASVAELIEQITGYIADRNMNPKPYIWKKKGEEIRRKSTRHGKQPPMRLLLINES